MADKPKQTIMGDMLDLDFLPKGLLGLTQDLDTITQQQKAIQPAQDKLDEIKERLSMEALTPQGYKFQQMPTVTDEIRGAVQPPDFSKPIKAPKGSGGGFLKKLGAMLPKNLDEGVETLLSPAAALTKGVGGVIGPLMEGLYADKIKMREMGLESDREIAQFQTLQDWNERFFQEEQKMLRKMLEESGEKQRGEETAEDRRERREETRRHNKRMEELRREYNAILRDRKKGVDLEDELQSLSEEPPENPEGDFYFVDRGTVGDRWRAVRTGKPIEAVVKRKPHTPPDATVKGPFKRRK